MCTADVFVGLLPPSLNVAPVNICCYSRFGAGGARICSEPVKTSKTISCPVRTHFAEFCSKSKGFDVSTFGRLTMAKHARYKVRENLLSSTPAKFVVAVVSCASGRARAKLEARAAASSRQPRLQRGIWLPRVLPPPAQAVRTLRPLLEAAAGGDQRCPRLG